MTEMFGEAWPPMSVPYLAPDDEDEHQKQPTPFFKDNIMTERGGKKITEIDRPDAM